MNMHRWLCVNVHIYVLNIFIKHINVYEEFYFIYLAGMISLPGFLRDSEFHIYVSLKLHFNEFFK